MKNLIKIAQKQMRSADLEARTPKLLLRLIIGENVFLSGGNTLDRVRPDLITIEDNVAIAGNVTILTHSKPPVSIRELIEDSLSVTAPVIIKKRAWITVNCAILPGVTIGENSIISAGSVVNKDVPAFAIVSSVPAKVVKIYKKTKER